MPPLDIYTISNLINKTVYFNEVCNFDDPVDSASVIRTGKFGAKAPTKQKINELLAL